MVVDETQTFTIKPVEVEVVVCPNNPLLARAYQLALKRERIELAERIAGLCERLGERNE